MSCSRNSVRPGQHRELPLVPACDGDPDAGNHGHQDDAGVHASEHPGAEGYPFRYASGTGLLVRH